MNVREFIRWLETQDQGATVEILVRRPGGWDGDYVRREDFNPDEHVDRTDMRGNQFAVGTPAENMRTLFLGED